MKRVIQSLELLLPVQPRIYATMAAQCHRGGRPLPESARVTPLQDNLCS